RTKASSSLRMSSSSCARRLPPCAARSSSCATTRMPTRAGNASSTWTSIAGSKRSSRRSAPRRRLRLLRRRRRRLRRRAAAPPRRGGRAAGGGATAAAAAPTPRPTGTDQQNYQAAFDLIQGRHYDEAGKAFTQFLVDFPKSPLADNSQYWLAETRYVQRQFKDALPEVPKVIDKYPMAPKMADATLKDRLCPNELRHTDAARAAR